MNKHTDDFIDALVDYMSAQQMKDYTKIKNKCRTRIEQVDVILDNWCPKECKNFEIHENIEKLYSDESNEPVAIERTYTCTHRRLCTELKEGLKNDFISNIN